MMAIAPLVPMSYAVKQFILMLFSHASVCPKIIFRWKNKVCKCKTNLGKLQSCMHSM